MAEVEVCRMFRNNGSCRHGDDCKYEHSEGEPIAPGGGGPAGECFTFRDEGSCSRGDTCRFTHGANDPRFVDGFRDISGEECRNWTRGSCRLGDECPRRKTCSFLTTRCFSLDERKHDHTISDAPNPAARAAFPQTSTQRIYPSASSGEHDVRAVLPHLRGLLTLRK